MRRRRRRRDVGQGPVRSTTSRSTPPPNPLDHASPDHRPRQGFATFSPDDARVVATVERQARGVRSRRPAHARSPTSRSAPQARNPTGRRTTRSSSYSDQGRRLAGRREPRVIPCDRAARGARRVIAGPPAGRATNLFPSFSPDGDVDRVLARQGRPRRHDRCSSGWRRPTAATPVELVNANRVVNNAVTRRPVSRTTCRPGRRRATTTGSRSTRCAPYGVVCPTGGTQQIWVAAIDQPSSGSRGGWTRASRRSASRSRGSTENNHRAFWTPDVRDIPDAGSFDARHRGAAGCRRRRLSNVGDSCNQTQNQCCSGLTCDVPSDGGSPDRVPGDAALGRFWAEASAYPFMVSGGA